MDDAAEMAKIIEESKGGPNLKEVAREFWDHQPTCPGCGYKLCFLDRQFDECPMCSAPIAEEVKVD